MHVREFLTLQEVEQTDGDLEQEVTSLTYDSRKAVAGTVFFAVPGEKVDGHDYMRRFGNSREVGAKVSFARPVGKVPDEQTDSQGFLVSVGGSDSIPEPANPGCRALVHVLQGHGPWSIYP